MHSTVRGESPGRGRPLLTPAIRNAEMSSTRPGKDLVCKFLHLRQSSQMQARARGLMICHAMKMPMRARIFNFLCKSPKQFPCLLFYFCFFIFFILLQNSHASLYFLSLQGQSINDFWNWLSIIYFDVLLITLSIGIFLGCIWHSHQFQDLLQQLLQDLASPWSCQDPPCSCQDLPWSCQDLPWSCQDLAGSYQISVNPHWILTRSCKILQDLI